MKKYIIGMSLIVAGLIYAVGEPRKEKNCQKLAHSMIAELASLNQYPYVVFYQESGTVEKTKGGRFGAESVPCEQASPFLLWRVSRNLKKQKEIIGKYAPAFERCVEEFPDQAKYVLSVSDTLDYIKRFNSRENELEVCRSKAPGFWGSVFGR